MIYITCYSIVDRAELEGLLHFEYSIYYKILCQSFANNVYIHVTNPRFPTFDLS